MVNRFRPRQKITARPNLLPAVTAPGAKWEARRGVLLGWLLSLLALFVLFVLRIQPVSITRPFYPDPIWGRKPILGYFALTPSIEGSLREGVALSPAQFRVIRRIAQEEVDAYRALEESSYPVIMDDNLTLEEKQKLIAEMGYNDRVMEIVREGQEQLSAELDPRTYGRLVRWIEDRWLVEQKLHGKPVMASSPRSFEVYATRYDSGGSYYVALPDKCVKFTNGGSQICDEFGYQAGIAYEVIVSYKKSTGARVGESGPWNIDDTYWATFGDPTPRRMFADLPLGMPEAQAAYFNGYNGGLDQFGRKVAGPFGIDLARQVSIDIGLKPGNNDWITVSFMWTAGWGDGASPGGSGAPDVTPVVIQPLQTAVPNADGSVIHEVRYGETLWTIAEAYKLTLNQLLNLNGLTKDAVILPGDQLVIRETVEPAEPSATVTEIAANHTATSTATRRPFRTATDKPHIDTVIIPENTPVTEDTNTTANNLTISPSTLLVLIGSLIGVGVLLMLVGGVIDRGRPKGK